MTSKYDNPESILLNNNANRHYKNIAVIYGYFQCISPLNMVEVEKNIPSTPIFDAMPLEALHREEYKKFKELLSKNGGPCE